MKQTKRILSLLLTLALVSSLFSFNTYAATVKISKTKLELEVGSSATLKISGTKSKVTWKSSNTKIATVSAKGSVKAIKKGSATITATVDKKSYSCKLTVNKKELTLDEIDKQLIDKGLVTGERTTTFASMIGAVDGFKYIDESVEIYEYDIKSDAYKNLLSTNKVKVEGFDFELTASAINEKFVLFCEDSDNKNEIVKAFKSIK